MLRPGTVTTKGMFDMLHWYRKYPPIRRKLTLAFGFMAGIIFLCMATAFWLHSHLSSAVEDNMTPRMQAAFDRTFATASTIFVTCTIVGVLAAIFFRKAIADPFVTTVVRMEALAAGDLDSEILFTDYQDCVGRITRAMHSFRDAAVARIAAEQEVRKNQDSQQIVVDALAGGLQQLASGNLSCRINAAFPSEYEQLRDNFNATSEALAAAIGSVAEAAEAIRTGSTEISTASDDLSRRTEQQAASLEETAAAMDQVTSSVRDTAKSAGDVSQAVAQAQADAQEGGRVAREAVEAMGGIEKSAQQIAQIISVIDGIAFQTNLLALNAGVEAARAGDAGKGFAVVASEVRALAQRSADAAKDIKELINVSTQQVDTGVKLVSRTGDALDRITTKVADTAGMIQQIAHGAQEQAGAISQVNTVVNDMDKMTQQNAAMVEQSTAAARSLADEANRLATLVNQFALGQQTSGHKNPAAAKPAPRVNRQAQPRTAGNLAIAVNEEDWTEF